MVQDHHGPQSRVQSQTRNERSMKKCNADISFKMINIESSSLVLIINARGRTSSWHESNYAFCFLNFLRTRLTPAGLVDDRGMPLKLCLAVAQCCERRVPLAAGRRIGKSRAWRHVAELVWKHDLPLTGSSPEAALAVKQDKDSP